MASEDVDIVALDSNERLNYFVSVMAETIHATKLAILNATERLVAAHGFEATSLRAITAAARVNLASVNYHFATKDALIVAMLNRRMKPLNEARIALLDRFERRRATRRSRSRRFSRRSFARFSS